MKKIHLICNSHIDPIWQWTWDEGISATISTFNSAVKLAEKHDYIFCHNESLLYEAIEKYAPQTFEKIKELVKQGKWKITGGWYLQPDCNLPCGESFVRQIKVGNEYFKNKFSVEQPFVATNYDSFGHSVGLVQILAKCGYKGYIHSRPWSEVFDYPGRFFKWTSPDGSYLISTNPVGGYGSGLGKATEKILTVLKKAEDVDYVLWGVGNHGGGPSDKDLTDIENFKLDGVEIIHSTPEKLFEDDIKISGEIKTSMNFSMPGCYSSMARIKQAYRQTENMFFATEKMLAVASLNGYKFDDALLKDAQKRMLLAQFHDMLPGTSVSDGEQEGLELLGLSRKVLKDYRTGAFLYLTSKKKRAKNGTYPVYAFNYAGCETTALVEAEMSLADANWDSKYTNIVHVYQNGKEIDSQLIKENSTINLDWRKRVIFSAKLDPLSLSEFVLIPEKIEKPANKLVLKPLEQYFSDKTLSDEIIPEIYDDTSDPWGMSDEELVSLGKNGREFTLMTDDKVKSFCKLENLSAVHPTYSGAIFDGYECLYTNGNTSAVIEYRFYKKLPYTDVKVTVEFADKDSLIRLKIPCPSGVPYGDGPYCTEEKMISREVNFQKWFGVKIGKDEFFAVINDGVYSGKYENGYLYLTLLRGVGYCFHPIDGVMNYPKDRYTPRIDCGRYEYNLRIFRGSLSAVQFEAQAFNEKPYAVNVFPDGNGEKLCMVKTDKPINMTALYEKEGIITARFYNSLDKAEKFCFSIGAKTCEIVIKAYSILTVKYNGNTFEVFDEVIPD